MDRAIAKKILAAISAGEKKLRTKPEHPLGIELYPTTSAARRAWRRWFAWHRLRRRSAAGVPFRPSAWLGRTLTNQEAHVWSRTLAAMEKAGVVVCYRAGRGRRVTHVRSGAFIREAIPGPLARSNSRVAPDVSEQG